MARTLHVYPKARVDGFEWTLIVKIYEPATRIGTRTELVAGAAMAVEVPLTLLKVGWDLIVADTDTDQDVVDSLTVDDIAPGPDIETVWINWMFRARTIVFGLTSPYTEADFWAAWTTGDTAQVRLDAQRAMVSGPAGGRGWTVVAGSVHQHEGDGTLTDG